MTKIVGPLYFSKVRFILPDSNRSNFSQVSLVYEP